MRRNADMGSRLRRAVLAAATLTTVAIASGGCAYVMPTTSLDRESPDKWFAKDIPVPEGFVLNKNESLVQDRGYRNLRLAYKRKDYIDMDRPWDFYREALTGRGWTLKYLYGFDKRGMIFWKGDEELRVTLDRNFANAFVTAMIEVEPKDLSASPGFAKRAE